MVFLETTYLNIILQEIHFKTVNIEVQQLQLHH